MREAGNENEPKSWLFSSVLNVFATVFEELPGKVVGYLVLGIYGAGGLGREVYELAKYINTAEKKWDDILFLVDPIHNPGKMKEIDDGRVLPPEEFEKQYDCAEAEVIIAVGEPAFRKEMREKIGRAGYPLAKLVHPSAYVSPGCILQPGVVVQYGCHLSTGCTIMENSFLQSRVVVAHDSKICEDCVISYGVSIAGNCIVGHQSYIGMNVPVRERTRIGACTIVGMGTVVYKDLPDSVVALGNPMRIVRENKKKRVFRLP